MTATCASSCPTPTAPRLPAPRAGLAGGLDRHPHRFRRPEAGAEAAIRWWQARGEDPRDKLMIFSDGLDVDRIAVARPVPCGRVRVSFGGARC
jgi:hypothetical protein